MKTRYLACLLPLVGLALWLALACREVTGTSESAGHFPYDPFARHDTLPAYPYNTLPSAGARPGAALVKPAGVDLDVTYISRAPMYNAYQVRYTDDLRPYLQPGTEDDQRWPAPGEVVTFTAHFANKGTTASGSFTFKWFVDETEVASGQHGGLGQGEAGMETYSWAWAHGLDGERLLGSRAVEPGLPAPTDPSTSPTPTPPASPSPSPSDSAASPTPAPVVPVAFLLDPATGVETVVPGERVAEVVAALKAAHPYEEPAYDLYPLADA